MRVIVFEPSYGRRAAIAACATSAVLLAALVAAAFWHPALPARVPLPQQAAAPPPGAPTPLAPLPAAVTYRPTPMTAAMPVLSLAAGGVQAPPAPRTTATPGPPWRSMARLHEGTQAQIVLYGRGRVVTLRGPGPLDDEYEVEAVFDDYLVLRHGPTRTGSFLPLSSRQHTPLAPSDPEASPRD